MLLMRGFDSVAHTLSLLSNNLDNALHVCLQLLIWTNIVSFDLSIYWFCEVGLEYEILLKNIKYLTLISLVLTNLMLIGF